MEDKFIKFDDGKARFSLICAEMEHELAVALTKGAAKYEDDNWKNCETPRKTYEDALRRHLNDWQKGEELDRDSGSPHLIAIICNAMFLRWFERNNSTHIEKMEKQVAQMAQTMSKLGV